MNIHLVTGGCGFVGRNMVKRLIERTPDTIVIIDDLSFGKSPEKWLGHPPIYTEGKIKVYGTNQQVIFNECDVRDFFKDYEYYLSAIHQIAGVYIEQFHDVYHFAAIVGGRSLIETDPLAVALDLAIDAMFFHWLSRHKPKRVLYPSSSAVYPVNLQQKNNYRPLKESDVDFQYIQLPDLTYGWSKLTGEYLAKTTALNYGVSIACVRPFSGYGEDQDTSYPIPAIVQRFARMDNPIKIWGDGTQGRDFVHIEDMLDCMELAIEKISDGSAINIGSGKLTSFIEVVEILSGIASYSPAIEFLLDKPIGVHNRCSDMTLTKQMLGWEAKIGLEEGLGRMIKSINPIVEIIH